MQVCDKALAEINVELDDVYLNKDTADAAVATRPDRLHTHRKNIYTESKYQKDTMLNISNAHISDSTNRCTDTTKFSIPTDL